MSARSVVLVGIVLGLLFPRGEDSSPRPESRAARRFPIAFAPEGSGFVARGSGGTLLLAPTRAAFSHGSQAAASIELVGANARAAGRGFERLPGRMSSFVGRDPEKCRADLPTFASVRFHDVYPGIDVAWHGVERDDHDGNSLEYDFLVRPGADAARIRLRFGEAGPARIGREGELVLASGRGEMRQLRPVSHQMRGATREPVRVEWRLRGRSEASFVIGPHDPTRLLVIDPVVVHSALLGGMAFDSANAVAQDGAGNIYVTGETASADFPTRGGSTPVPAGGTDAFVAKLDPTASVLLYSTFFGGNQADSGNAIAVDAAGSAWVTGETASDDFPTTAGGFQRNAAGASDAFVVRLDVSGSALLSSTYLGGEGFDRGNGLALDSGEAVVTGRTGSADFPTTPGALQTFFRGGDFDAFVSRLDGAGGLAASTYLGGSENDAGFGVAVDAGGHAFVTGGTRSTDFPATAGAYQSGNFSTDAFVSRLDRAGALEYSTFLGGSGVDRGNAIAVDQQGRAIVAGQTSSADFPAVGSLQGFGGGQNDAFVAVIDPLAAGSASLVFSMPLGGSGDDRALAVATGRAGSLFVAGQTSSSNFPTVAATQAAFGGGANDAFVASLDLSGTPRRRYSTFLGGAGDDRAQGIVASASGDAVVAGRTDSPDFPGNPIRFGAGGAIDAFIARLGESESAAVPALSWTMRFLLAAALGGLGMLLTRRG